MFGKQRIPPGMIQLTALPIDELGEPVWNEEVEAQTRARGADFLAPLMVEVSPDMCMTGFVAKAQYHNAARSYEATAVLVTRKNDELRTTVSITAPSCWHQGAHWEAFSQRLSASLPKEHVANMVHTLRGLCEQAHAQELLKAGNRGPSPQPESDAPKAPIRERNGFAVNEFVVYPAHGVGQILAIESQTIAGADLEMFVVNFPQEKMTLRIPTARVANIGMRKISAPAQIDAALSMLAGCDDDLRKQTTELVARIESGDVHELARVLRELRPWRREEMYKSVFERLAKEVAVSRYLTDEEAANEVESYLSRSQ